MKIFGWVANKIGGKQESRRSANSTAPYRANVSECRKDEFSDWPQSLLAIGTFGNKQIEKVAQSSSGNVQTMKDSVKFTEEEVDKIRKEFEVLLESNNQAEVQGSYDDEQVASQKHVGEDDNEKYREHLINKEIIVSKAREIVGKKGSALKPRSIASLLKLFACKGGFTSTVLEPRNSFPQSRMEKLLRAILQKKIHPKNSSMLVTRRHLDWKPDEKEINGCLEDALRDLDEDGAKWVKTDSDFIVLEM
ncbi:protein DEEPER ROOTING 1-like [Phragmites australis]|uniref:protein DEEPER ROOTING 1-like n=1 Tax=Phragmites australis TaxID=29695 RepID=UPI002D77A61C|nr:protein DEEPER ROOTING 1-like [Phragmites australis]